MDFLLAFASGVICTIMIAWNGQLSSTMGLYASTIMIHFMGLLTILLLLKWKHIHICFRNHLPFFFYTGGMIGVLTVFFNSFSIQIIGASLVSALGLLGQISASLVLEHKGWLQSVQSKITKEKIISLCIILLGIGVMLT